MERRHRPEIDAHEFFFLISDDRTEWVRVVFAGVAAKGLVGSFVVEKCELQFGANKGNAERSFLIGARAICR